jgi:hypothetical protein
MTDVPLDHDDAKFVWQQPTEFVGDDLTAYAATEDQDRSGVRHGVDLLPSEDNSLVRPLHPVAELFKGASVCGAVNSVSVMPLASMHVAHTPISPPRRPTLRSITSAL